MEAQSKKISLAKLLLNWYDNHDRQLPWRETVDPYKIWISEIMLQQTQVKTVVPYYKQWIALFPNIKSVADADPDAVLKAWEGLGYYARVRNFQKSSKIILKKHNGKLPNEYNLLLTLPGIGEYIAGAIMSIAFKKPIPAVDSNVLRVISRLYTINGASYHLKKEISTILSKLVCDKRPGDFNQAIMDLGREVCKPKNPCCDMCPINKICCATVNNVVDKYPPVTTFRKKPHYNIAAAIIWNKNKILVSKRKEKGLLGGLWEFPGGKIKEGETPEQCVIREASEELGVCIKSRSFLKQITHAYSHFSITLDAYNCDYIDGAPRALGCADWRWILPEQITDLPFPKANHKLFDCIYMSLK